MTLRWNWGTSIALVYAVFATATIAFVVFAMTQPVDLVSRDYYAQALQQDARQLARTNAAGLPGFAVDVSPDGRQIAVSWPRASKTPITGMATLYRASNSGDDRRITLTPDWNGRQVLSLAGLPAGHWQLQLSWHAGDRWFYSTHPVRAQ